MENNLCINDLKLMDETISDIIHRNINSYRGVKFHQSDIDPYYVTKLVQRENKELFDLQKKLHSLINNIKETASSDKELNSDSVIKPATSRFQVKVKYFENHNAINEFLDNKNVEFVDLKVDRYDYTVNYHLLYRTIEIDA